MISKWEEMKFILLQKKKKKTLKKCKFLLKKIYQILKMTDLMII